jgi:Leucine-rich repeat (LRR) protein
MKIIVTLVIFLKFCIDVAKCVNIECEFTTSLDHYTCGVKNSQLINSDNDREITGMIIRGKHLSGKTNDDVKNFQMISVKSIYFPRGVTKIIKNIECVVINVGNLREISKDDLREFGDKLKQLWLGSNEIEVIESNLFDFNKNIEVVSFANNSIKHIEPNTFQRLKNLKTLRFHENLCTSSSDYAENDVIKVVRIIKIVEYKCKNLEIVLSRQIENLKKFIEVENSKISQNFQKMENELKREISGLNGKLAQCHLVNNNSSSKFN